MLLMVEKGTRSGTHHSIHRYVRANSKYMKDYDKNKQSSYLKYWGVNTVHGWDMLQKLPVGGNISFNKNFTKSYNKDSDEGYFLEVYVQYPEELHEFHNDVPFLPKRMKFKKLKNV